MINFSCSGPLPAPCVGPSLLLGFVASEASGVLRVRKKPGDLNVSKDLAVLQST